DIAIERWRVPLLGHVMEMFAELGLTEGSTVERVSKPLYRLVLGKLRRAESAVRRLIVVAARTIVLEPPPQRTERAKAEISNKDQAKAEGEAKAETPVKIRRKRRPSFNLFDPLKRFEKGYRRPAKRPQVEPRAYFLDVPPGPNPIFLLSRKPKPQARAPVVEEKVDDGMVDATRLIRRLLAVMDALQDIPRQAMRLARWEARPKEERRPERWSPLRAGKPPGFRERAKHELDEILRECHWLARSIYPPLDDTS
ncbi:MAG: hypothetical protein JNJ53_15275, partial [Rhizobiales bacterium]|nr:hypothetical protein [Hyphomicrobiales bacterium]